MNCVQSACPDTSSASSAVNQGRPGSWYPDSFSPGRQGKLEERHLAGRRAAGQAENRLTLPEPTADRLTRSHFDVVIQLVPLQLVQDRDHQITLTAPGPANCHDRIADLVRRHQLLPDGLTVVFHHRQLGWQAKVGTPRGQRRQITGIEQARAKFATGQATSSSPVAMMPTRGRRTSSTRSKPAAASSPICPGRNTVPSATMS